MFTPLRAAKLPYLASQEKKLHRLPHTVARLIRQSANSRVFRDSNGMINIEDFSVPINYWTPLGWKPISNQLRPVNSHAGWVGTSSNSWTVAFGSFAQGLSFHTPVGSLSLVPGAGGDRSAPPAGAAPVIQPGAAPTRHSGLPAPGVVSYRNAWPEVTVRDTVRSNSLAEDLVLASAAAGSRFSFVVGGPQLTPGVDGGVTLSGDMGRYFTIAPPRVLTADGVDVTKTSLAHYELTGGSVGTALAVVLSPSWLQAQPASAFPITIDPDITTTSASVVSYSNTGGSIQGGSVQIGVDTSGALWRSAFSFNQYDPYLNQNPGYRVYDAVLAFAPEATGPPTTQIALYGQGAKPSSFSQIATGVPGIGSILDPNPNILSIDVSSTMDSWVTQGLADQWFGVQGTETPGSPLRDYSTVQLDLWIYQPPAASRVTNLTSNSVLSTLTPTLQAQAVSGSSDGAQFPMYDYEITTGSNPGTGLVVSSGELEGNIGGSGSVPSWQVPVGGLQQGVTYHAWVLTDFSNNQPPVPQTTPPTSWGVTFTVNLGLGDGGPSPTDAVGSLPGQTDTPSQGAPNPSLPGSKITVNMVDGNASVTVGTPKKNTVSGGLSLGFTYNSLAVGAGATVPGLLGYYYDDVNNTGVVQPGDPLVGERVDPTIGFDWGSSAGIAAQFANRALAQWTGYLTLPNNHQWKLGDISSDGLTVTLSGNSVLNDNSTHQPQAAPTFGTTFTPTAGSPMSITVNWRHSSSNPAVAEVVAEDVTANQVYPLSPAWLTHNPQVLPAGWTLNSRGGQANFVGLEDHGTSVTVFAHDGTAYEFPTGGTAGYTSPPQLPNDLLRVDPAGNFVLDDASGFIYTFAPTGVLQSATSATDDQHPAALVYGYNQAITLVGTTSGKDLTGTSSSLTVNLPGGTASGDQVLVGMTEAANESSWISGYTAVGSWNQATGDHLDVFDHTVASGETSLTVNWVRNGSVQPKEFVVAVYRGVNPTNPVDAITGNAPGSTTSLTLGPLSPALAKDELVFIQSATGNTSNATWSASSMTEEVQATENLASSAIADQPLSFGSTGTRTATISGSLATPSLAGGLLALRPGLSSPPLLRTIADPVSAQVTNLFYGGDANAPAACSGAPALLLCDIAFWDGTSTSLTYDSNGNLSRITNPGGVIYDFAYNSSGLLTVVRDPLAYDAISAGGRSDCPASSTSTPTCDTTIAYDTSGRASTVTQPAPAAGVAQPERLYCYNAATASSTSLACGAAATGTASVAIVGLNPTSGFAEQVTFDARNRIVSSTDAAGHTTTYTWNSLDLPVAKINPDGSETSTAYDATGHAIAKYGPAPQSSFQSNGAPVNGANVPTTTNVYDGGISGLAAAWYPKPQLLGTPAYHTTSNLAESWPAGTSPSSSSATPGLIPSSGFSGDLTGLVTLPQPGPVRFTGDGGAIYMDGNLLLNQLGGPYAQAVRQDRPSNWWRLGDSSGSVTAADSSGASPGVYSGGVSPGQPGPMADGDSTAALFDGATGTVSIPDTSSLRFSNIHTFSVEAWVKTASTAQQSIASKLGPSPAYQGWEFGLTNGNPYLFLSNTFPTNDLELVGSTSVADGNWHHLFATYNGNSSTSGIQLFVDGALVTTTTSPANSLSASSASSAPLYLGSRGGSSQFFAGALEDVAVYQGIPTSASISGHHAAAGVTSATSSTPVVYNTPYPESLYGDTPVSYWRLADASATTAADSYGQSPGSYNGGVIVGQSGGLPGDPSTAATLNGTSGYVSLAPGLVMSTGFVFSVEARFKTTSNGPIFGEQSTPVGGGPANYDPAIYVGTDGKLHGGFWQASGLASTQTVNDGAWHDAALTVDPLGNAALYLDGAQVASGVNAVYQNMAYDQIGAGVANGWPASPNGWWYFNGTISDVSMYASPLSPAQVYNHYIAGATAPATANTVHHIEVLDQQFVSGGQLAVSSSVSGSSFDPDYGLLTQTTDPDGKVTQTSLSDAAHGIGPQFGLATSTTQDPGGLALTSATTYETPGPGTYLRVVSKTLPAGNQSTYLNYGGTDAPIAAVCGVAPWTPQAGLVEQVTDPAPATGVGDAEVRQYVYDAAGRQVGDRVGTVNTISSLGWACTTYDNRDRMTSQSWPSFGTAGGRTVSYSYAVGGNPLVNSVTDSNWSGSAISATVDLLSRIISYTDIWGNTTTTTYNQAGQQIGTNGPMGTITAGYDQAGEQTTTAQNSTTLATSTYDSTSGRLSSVSYSNSSSVALGYDANGRQNGVTVNEHQGQTGETDTLSAAARISSSTPAGGGTSSTYTYDGAARVTQAALPAVTYNYGYAATTGCPANGAGANTNRTSLVVTGSGAGTTNYCYDQADRLVSDTTDPTGSVAYDVHGNTVQRGTEFYQYDASDRLVRTETPTAVNLYARDPLSRIARRTTITPITEIGTTTNTTTAASLTLSAPPGTLAGDLLVAALTVENTGTLSLSDPSWTIAATQKVASSQTWVLYRQATNNDPSSWSFGFNSVTVGITGSITTYRNASSSGPIDVTATTSNSLSSSQTLPRVTSNTDAETVFYAVGYTGGVTPSAPGDTNQRAAVNARQSLLVADAYQDQAGTTPARLAHSSAPAPSMSITVALVPRNTVSRLGYAAESDAAGFVQTPSGSVAEVMIPLQGGVTYDGGVWSYANVRGDTIATTDISGNLTWTGYWGPYGEAASGSTPANSMMPGVNYGYNGKQQKLSDVGLIEMGARSYDSSNGRFLTVDPIQGGCANDFTYASGDPINHPDLSGESWWNPASWHWGKIGCFGLFYGGLGIAAFGAFTGDPLLVALGLVASIDAPLIVGNRQGAENGIAGAAAGLLAGGVAGLVQRYLATLGGREAGGIIAGASKGASVVDILTGIFHSPCR